MLLLAVHSSIDPIQCVRLGKSCAYPLKEHPEIMEDKDSLLQKIQHLEYQLEHARAGKIDDLGVFSSPLSAAPAPFPKSVILDAETFTTLPRGVLDVAGETPCKVIDAIGIDPARFCDSYFAGPHHWFPFLSRKRIKLMTTLVESNPSAALLLISMKLLAGTLQPHEEPRTGLYQLTKEFIGSVEDSGSTSLPLVQAIILTAIYELGHAIYPAAYLSISRAVRLSYLLGLHDKHYSTQMFKAPDTWTGCEEERRSWWALIILDR